MSAAAVEMPPSNGTKRGSLTRPSLGQRLATIPLYVLALSMLAPFYWMVISSFKSVPEITRSPPTWIPQDPTLNNFYDRVWNPDVQNPGHTAGLFQRFTQVSGGYWKFMFNSVLISTSITLGALLIASLAALVIAKHQLPGRRIIYLLIIGSMMLPWQVTLIPNYITVSDLGWLSTYQGYIIPALAKAFVVFFLVQYLQSLPDELFQAARVDGAGEWRIWWSVVLPLLRPALAAMAIFVVLGEWNNFLWPLIIVTGDDSMATLPVALARLNSNYPGAQNSGVIMVAALIASLPTVIFFLVFQKQFTRGITITGLKG
ncbi:carbohydrate ABC transporter permease [Luedemannella flava]|uniref:Carbohydrate ABC transporter permease n=1 Tax=Luedemannella flava TaxID=349316 RepID=A0ABN2MA44_9ACTN